MTLKILGGIAALLLGVWLGLPGRYEASESDIERAMDQGGARRNQVRRRFTPIDWFRKDRRGSQKRQERSPFKMAGSSKRER